MSATQDGALPTAKLTPSSALVLLYNMQGLIISKVLSGPDGAPVLSVGEKLTPAQHREIIEQTGATPDDVVLLLAGKHASVVGR